MPEAAILDPAAAQARIAELEAALERQTRIGEALIERALHLADAPGNAFQLFDMAATLERRVRDRTLALERVLAELAEANAALARSQREAEEARQRLADAIESSNEGIAIFDSEDRLVLCNATYRSLWPEIADRLVPGIRFDEIVRLVAETGSTLAARAAPARYISERLASHSVAGPPHIHALLDGRWIQVNELRTREGGIVGVYTDITQVKAEDARARTRELAERSGVLQATLDSIWDGVAVFDRRRQLVAWNDALRLILRLPEDVQGAIATHDRLAAHCSGPDFFPGCPTLEWPASPEAPPLMRSATIADGRTLEVRRRGMPDGGVVLSFHDVTEERRAREALTQANELLERRVAERTAEAQEAQRAAEEANRSKTRFLAAASHDLLQPLNAARLFVAALGERRLAPESRALVRQAAAALDSVEDLLEALLEISRMDAGAITPEVVDIALADILEPLREEFAPFARRRGLAYVVEPTAAHVRTDPRLLRRILQNLISNALRYTDAGEVRVSAQAGEGSVLLSVRDTGPGIPAEAHDLIFEEFRRLDQPGRERGMGLGLAIVRRAARMLGHRLALESAPGAGSTFSIELPRGIERPARPAAPRTPRDRAAGATVLVIDNDAAIIEGMKALLGGWKCRVLAAGDLETARQALAGDAPALLLVDYHLDGMTGDEVVARLRAEAGRSLPAILVTADRSAELRECMAALDLPVLGKPVKPAQLRALMARILG